MFFILSDNFFLSAALKTFTPSTELEASLVTPDLIRANAQTEP